MFDPTIYENLKVVLEGAIYDLDFANEIIVTDRSDVTDLAKMAREFVMQFQTSTTKSQYPIAEVRLRSTLQDFATEKINGDDKTAGCVLEVNFFTNIQDTTKDCFEIEKMLNEIWQNRPTISQEISYTYSTNHILKNKININFGRKINEDQINDFEQVLHFTLQSLRFLEDYK
ncbi:hypothetical protein BTR23_08210 [Alkalihalophilus pseudofirmus]|uniref:hypothetical protein n=1 Tax=Alkalihalobacterium alkalinitrilicum TaxID=427920 RepID=UPI00094BF1F5|nr:hypothetical protein [Alkalihalobacterium alkalinitrilicum]OLO40456.1 hypothetical protein BTR23_08210 [Alkalihalophilus pseudofirmus]